MKSQSTSQHLGRRGWLLYHAAWVPAIILYAVSASAQRDVTWWQGLISSVCIMGFAALAGMSVWWLTGLAPLNARKLRFILLHAIAGCLYSAALVAAMIGWIALVAPREVAARVLREAGLWQFSTGLYVYGLLAGAFYLVRTQRQLREREGAAARAQAAAATSQLQTLRAQLNPHFLFNALHAVGSLVRTDPAAADRALERIGELLRRSLDHTSQELVPLGQEWEFVRGYLELEQLRLGDRLALDVTLDPLALPALVPALVLQPLVENAVRHGIAQLPNGGTLHISAARRNGIITIHVADDGPGAATVPPRGKGFGLDAVRGQLEGRYGDRARMQVETAPGKGFAVTLVIPVSDSP